MRVTLNLVTFMSCFLIFHVNGLWMYGIIAPILIMIKKKEVREFLWTEFNNCLWTINKPCEFDKIKIFTWAAQRFAAVPF